MMRRTTTNLTTLRGQEVVAAAVVIGFVVVIVVLAGLVVMAAARDGAVEAGPSPAGPHFSLASVSSAFCSIDPYSRSKLTKRPAEEGTLTNIATQAAMMLRSQSGMGKMPF